MTATDTLKSTKITTAVEFLSDVNEKGYSTSLLRKYLMEKRGLTAEEVEEAFVLNRGRAETPAREKLGNKSKKERVIWSNGSSERAEKSTGPANAPFWDLSLLLPSKRAAGHRLINGFLDHEKIYISTLECLQKEYYEHIARFADHGKFQMSRKEVDEIFKRIPDMLRFHKGFFWDLQRGSNIGRMFVQQFKFFEGYAEYMKDIQRTLNKMQMYIRDNKLSICLALVSERSSRQNVDMIDLLLTPLERIREYKNFLDTLLSWTDRSQTTDYEVLGKASRRIGRVAAYIEKYKYGISNQNEMNKVQRFLGDQCDILAPDRAIIRRGMMMSRNASWTARNKRQVFFLFNDMLLWTNKNGTLQNAVHLSICEAIPSCAKNNPERKFEILYRGKRPKTIKLECEGVEERNDWYSAVERTIVAAKENRLQASSKSEPVLTEKYKEYSDNLGDGENKAPELFGVDRVDEEDSRLEQSEKLDNPYNKRYTFTSSFRIQEFKTFDPMGDNVSQISEQDVAFYQQKRHKDESSLPTSAILSPFGQIEKGEKTGRSNEAELSPERKKELIAIADFQRNSCEDLTEDIKEHSEFSYDKRQNSNIIRCSNIVDENTIAKPSSRFTIRLDDL